MKGFTRRGRVVLAAWCAAIVTMLAGIAVYLLLSPVWRSAAEAKYGTTATMAAGTVILLVDVSSVYVLVVRLRVLPPLPAFLSLLAGLLGGVGFGYVTRTRPMTTCYFYMMKRSRSRTPHRVVTTQQQWLEEFHSKGIISGETHARADAAARRASPA